MPLAIGLSMLFSAAMGTPATASTAAIINPDIPQAQTLRQYVTSYFSDAPIMVAIAGCESHFHQYGSDGSLFRGEINNLDVGVMQINQHYHSAEAKAMGIDLTSLQGNLEFARYLYKNEGTAPWDSSSKCWAPTEDSKTLAVNSEK